VGVKDKMKSSNYYSPSPCNHEHGLPMYQVQTPLYPLPPGEGKVFFGRFRAIYHNNGRASIIFWQATLNCITIDKSKWLLRLLEVR